MSPTEVGPCCGGHDKEGLRHGVGGLYLPLRGWYSRLSYNPGPMRDVGRFVRRNAFLVAAVALPLVVVIFFLLAAAIPRWTVAPPDFDLVLRGTSYEQPAPRVSLEFDVRDGRVQATVR